MARAMCILLAIAIPQLLLGAARSTGSMTRALLAAVSGAISAVVEMVCGVGHQPARDETTQLLSDEKCDDTPLAAGPRPVMIRRGWKLGAAASALLLLLLAFTAPPPPPTRATGVRLKAENTKGNARLVPSRLGTYALGGNSRAPSLAAIDGSKCTPMCNGGVLSRPRMFNTTAAHLPLKLKLRWCCPAGCARCAPGNSTAPPECTPFRGVYRGKLHVHRFLCTSALRSSCAVSMGECLLDVMKAYCKLSPLDELPVSHPAGGGHSNHSAATAFCGIGPHGPPFYSCIRELKSLSRPGTCNKLVHRSSD